MWNYEKVCQLFPESALGLAVPGIQIPMEFDLRLVPNTQGFGFFERTSFVTCTIL